MDIIWEFIASWIRAYGSPETQKTVLGKTYPEEPVCVKSLPEGGVYRVDCQSSGVEVRPREHWGRVLGRAWRALVSRSI
jgi:hypothetical protein